MEIAAGKAGATAPSLRWYDQLFINANWFALTLRSQVLAGLLVPLLVQGFVGEDQKGAYFGTIRLWALMGALLFQALFGILSDHSRLRWGRRRPFILVGAILDVAIIMSMAWVVGLHGLSGYYILFGLYLLSMAFTNMSQAATQGLIPDLVPQEKRGVASSIKTLLEVPLPLVIIGLVIAPIFEKGDMLLGLVITGVTMLACMGLTMLAKEKPLESAPALNWKPFTSLLFMTAVFTGIILGLGQVVKASIPLFPADNRLAFGLIGVTAMSIAVVAGVFASLYIHLGASARQNRSFTWLVINRLAALVAITNIGVFLLYFVQEKFNLPGKQAAGLAGTLPLVLGVCVIFFGIGAGWLSDRMDRRLLTVISGFIGALGVAIMVIGQTQALMYVAAAFIGMAYAAFSVASWALGTDIVPKERSGEFLGLQNLAGAGAGAIGAYIGGAIADSSGYVLLMTMFVVMFLLSSLAALLVRPAEK
jgi:Na+/melibiose symporter-like transporter